MRATAVASAGRVVALAAALALGAAACTSTTTSPDGGATGNGWPLGSGKVPVAHHAPARTSVDGKGLVAGAEVRDVADCRTLARGPWARVGYRNDPLTLVREGRLPVPGQGAQLGSPDQLHDFADVDDYRDHSTYTDPGAIHEAMVRAGFEAGAEAVWGHGQHLSVITVVRYRDAAGARDVLTAQLDDYCNDSMGARVLDDRDGLAVFRWSGSSRVVFVLDDTVVSVLTCGCAGVGADVWAAPLLDQIERGSDDPTS